LAFVSFGFFEHPAQPQERVAAVETALREHAEVKEADVRNLVSMVGERVSGLADRLESTHAERGEHLHTHDEALQLQEKRHVRFQTPHGQGRSRGVCYPRGSRKALDSSRFGRLPSHGATTTRATPTSTLRVNP